MGTPYQKASATSRESARIIDETGSADDQMSVIMEYVLTLGAFGVTVDEATKYLKKNGFPHVHNGTVAGQFVRLEKAFKIKKTADTRKSSSGRMVTIFVQHDGTPYEIQKTPKESSDETIEAAANFLSGLVIAKQLPGAAFIKRAQEIEADLRNLLEKA